MMKDFTEKATLHDEYVYKHYTMKQVSWRWNSLVWYLHEYEPNNDDHDYRQLEELALMTISSQASRPRTKSGCPLTNPFSQL